MVHKPLAQGPFVRLLFGLDTMPINCSYPAYIPPTSSYYIALLHSYQTLLVIPTPVIPLYSLRVVEGREGGREGGKVCVCVCVCDTHSIQIMLKLRASTTTSYNYATEP